MPPAPGSAPAKPAKGDSPATVMQAQPDNDPEKTNVFEGALPPAAMLSVNRSPAANRLGPVVYVSAVPFRVGRGSQGGNDLSLDEDTSVSRNHATLTFEAGVYYVTDLGSSNGTLLDGVRLTANARMPLRDGSVITFGKGTEVTFRLTGSSSTSSNRDDDPGKTDYVNMDDLRK